MPDVILAAFATTTYSTH